MPRRGRRNKGFSVYALGPLPRTADQKARVRVGAFEAPPGGTPPRARHLWGESCVLVRQGNRVVIYVTSNSKLVKLAGTGVTHEYT